MRAIARAFAYLWAFPTTGLGLMLAGTALLTGGRSALVGHVLEAHGGALSTLLERGPLARAGIAAITLGHVIVAASQQELDRCRMHERVHVEQCERWGPLFLPAYAAASLWARLCGRDPYRDNRFEREAVARSREVPGALAGPGSRREC